MITKEMLGELLVLLEIPLKVEKFNGTDKKDVYEITISTSEFLLDNVLLLKVNEVKEYFDKKQINPKISTSMDSLNGYKLKIDGLIYFENAK